MIILSQNEEVIVNTDVLAIYKNAHKPLMVLADNYTDESFLLGKYSTSDRVKEVIQELFIAAANGEKSFRMPKE